MNVKSERLRKLELELEDLQQWKRLGLVPKKDLSKHEEETKIIKVKIEEEKDRIKFLKDNGELEEYVTPKKNAAKQSYAEPQTLPDVTIAMVDNTSDMEVEMEETATAFDGDTFFDESAVEEEGAQVEAEEDEDPFSDRNRWKRGVLEDPDAEGR